MKKTIISLAVFLTVAVLAFLATYLGKNLRLEIGIAAGLISFILMIAGRRQLGKYFTVMPQAKGLVTIGLYSRIRHPMYFFLDLLLASVIVILNMPVLLLPWAFLIILQTIQSKKEEKILANAFGTKYEEYRSRTWF